MYCYCSSNTLVSGIQLRHCTLLIISGHRLVAVHCEAATTDVMLFTGVPGSQGPCCTKPNLNCVRIHTNLRVIAFSPRHFPVMFRDRRFFSTWFLPLTATSKREGRPACNTRPRGMWRLRCLLQLVSCLNEAVSIMGFIAATFIALFFTDYFYWRMLLGIFCWRNTIPRVRKSWVSVLSLAEPPLYTLQYIETGPCLSLSETWQTGKSLHICCAFEQGRGTAFVVVVAAAAPSASTEASILPAPPASPPVPHHQWLGHFSCSKLTRRYC